MLGTRTLGIDTAQRKKQTSDLKLNESLPHSEQNTSGNSTNFPCITIIVVGRTSVAMASSQMELHNYTDVLTY